MGDREKLMSLLNLMIERYDLKNNFLVSGYIGIVQERITKMKDEDAKSLVDSMKGILNS